MSELKAFDVGLGRCTEDGYPCVVAYGADQNPRVLNEKVYLKDEADKVFAEKDEKIRRLRRALLLVCAKRADAEAHIENNLADLLLKGQTWSAVDYHRLERDKWYKRAVSCRAKAEECKEAKNEST